AAYALIRPILKRDLERLLDGRCAVRCEEEMCTVDRDDLRKRLRELDDDSVAVAEQRRMRAAIELLANRGVQFRYAVTERREPQRCDRIQVASSFDIDELAAHCTLDDDRSVLRIARHLREAVPNDSGIALGPGERGIIRGVGHFSGCRL